jgi:hypothetical protein
MRRDMTRAARRRKLDFADRGGLKNGIEISQLGRKMISSGKLLLGACISLSLCDVSAALAAKNRNFVQLKYFCTSAAKPDAGFKIILVEAANCSAARHTIQDAVAMELGDPCHAQDADTWTARYQEIQVNGCARQ